MAKILIVDDDASFREGLVEAVSDLGHEAITAASGESAFRELERADFIFSTCECPEQTAWNSCERSSPIIPNCRW